MDEVESLPLEMAWSDNIGSLLCQVETIAVSEVIGIVAYAYEVNGLGAKNTILNRYG